MGREQFDEAVALFTDLSEAEIEEGMTLRQSLCFGTDVSFWDIAASYLVLYRFPLLFPESVKPGLFDTLKSYFRPYRGGLARFRDEVRFLSRPVPFPKAFKQDQNRKKVLFLGFVPTFYRDVLKPVVKLMAERKDISIVVIGEDIPMDPIGIETTDVEFQSIWHHWNRESRGTARELVRHLNHFQKVLLSEKGFSRLVDQTSTKPFVKGLKNEFKWFAWRELRRLIPQFVIASEILNRYQPSLVVSADDADQRCRIYSLLSKQMKIPTLLIQQGVSDRNYPEWQFFSQKKVAAMGMSSQNDMIDQGIPPSDIKVTGHPGFDQLVHSGTSLKKRIFKELGIQPGSKMILFASQPYYVGAFSNPDIRREMISAIADACEIQSNTILVVKPHPGENHDKLRQIIGKRRSVLIVEKSAPIIPLIKSCDVLITFFSTTALQALYAGKPVINVKFPGCGGLNLYSDSGATWIAQSSGEIELHLHNLLGRNRIKEIDCKREKIDNFLFDFIYRADGKAASRIVKMADDMMQLQSI